MINVRGRMRAAIENAREWGRENPQVCFDIAPSEEEDWTENYAYAEYHLERSGDPYFDYSAAVDDVVAALHERLGEEFTLIWDYDPKRVLVNGALYLHMRGGEIEAYRHRTHRDTTLTKDT